MPGVCAEVVQSNDIPKSMRIVITSGMVNSERFAQGIRETLAPALEKASLLQVAASSSKLSC